MKTEQKKRGTTFLQHKSQEQFFFKCKYIYIYMKHIYLKLTVKYEHIYIVLQGSKGKKAICNIPLNPIIPFQINVINYP